MEWHELKLGVFHRQEQAARTEGGRGLLADKVVGSWMGAPLELGRRLQWEAQREGLAGRGTCCIWATAPPGSGT